MKRATIAAAVALSAGLSAVAPASGAGLDETIADLREALPEKPGLPGADRAGWALLARHPQSAKIIAKAEKLRKAPIPDTPDELYLEFWNNGNRSRYEKPYGKRVNRLVVLTVAEALERRGRFVPDVVEAVDAICSMKSWVLPAHDWADGGGGNFRGTAVTVDLGSSAVASHLACTVNYLGEALSGETVAKIRREVERRVFAPMRLTYSLMDDDGRFAKNSPPAGHWWTCGANNWNAVCHDNVVTAALGLLESRDDRAFFVACALRGLRYYARGGFTADGYCTEGMGYWNYGYGHLLMLGLRLRDMTGGRIDVFADPIYRKAAEYAYGYQLERGVSPAFADGNGAPAPVNLALARRVWPDLTCRAAEEVPPFGTAGQSIANACCDWYVSLLGFGRSAPPSGAEDRPLPLRTAFPVGQVWLMRLGDRLSVAVKGGNNGEHHNHNDVGSYYLVSRGRLLSGDPGGEVYTKRTFGPKRYESKVLSSYGHPVPVVGGKLQSKGAKFAAKVVKTDFTDERDVVVLDIAGAYEVEPLRSLVRTFVFDRVRGVFSVTDRAEFSRPTEFEEAYNTFEGREFGKVDVSVAVAAGGEVVRSSERVENPGKISPVRHAVRFAEPVSAAEITFTFKPVEKGEAK